MGGAVRDGAAPSQSTSRSAASAAADHLPAPGAMAAAGSRRGLAAEGGHIVPETEGTDGAKAVFYETTSMDMVRNRRSPTVDPIALALLNSRAANVKLSPLMGKFPHVLAGASCIPVLRCLEICMPK